MSFINKALLVLLAFAFSALPSLGGVARAKTAVIDPPLGQSQLPRKESTDNKIEGLLRGEPFKMFGPIIGCSVEDNIRLIVENRSGDAKTLLKDFARKRWCLYIIDTTVQVFEYRGLAKGREADGMCVVLIGHWTASNRETDPNKMVKAYVPITLNPAIAAEQCVEGTKTKPGLLLEK